MSIIINFVNVFLIIVFSSCSLFQPKLQPINEVYLTDKNDAENKKIDELEGKIIKYKEQINASESNRKILEQKLIVNNKKIEYMRYELDFLKELKNLQLISAKEDTANDTNHKINEQSNKVDSEVLFGRILIAKIKLENANEILKRAEMAKSIAELDLVKATIGERKQKAMGITKENKDYIVLDKYKESLNFTTDKLFSAKKGFDTSQSETEQLEQQLKATGYIPGY